jgi:glc operon protein GlcG
MTRASSSLFHMDGARAYTVEIASQKARTSANVGVPTSAIEAMYREQPGQSRELNIGAKPEVDEMIAGISVPTA